MIDIKDISGKTRLSIPINKGAKGKFTLMKEDYIILPFSVAKPVQFKLGDYVDLSGVLDESLGGKLAKIYEITDLQKPTYNTSTGGYDYNLQMNAYYWKWKNKIFKYTPEHAGNEASWSLTAALDVQLGVFLRNLKALGYTYRGADFTFSIDDTVENKAVAMTYDNMNLLDALFSMAGEDKWNCDCWITDNVIHFGRNEFGDAVKIERGVEASSITRSESQGTYATRIYAFGSTKNIPTNYRPTDEQAVVNGIVQKRLMLPADTPYIDAYESMSQEEAIEDVVVFDDVYPRRVGTLSDVHTRTEEVENEDGTKETITYYRYKDTGLEFKEEYILEGEELKIQFQSGKLNGMEFGVIFNPKPKDESRGDQLWEIVRNEDYGRPLPDDMMYPANGDEYILSGFDIQLVSDQYIPEAEQELKGKAQKYADKVKKDDGTYPTTLRSSWVKENLISRTFEFGQRINLVDDTYFENGRISRVLGWEMNLDIPWDSPVYTIGESMPYSRIGEIESDVESLTYKGQTYFGKGGVYLIKVNDSTAPSDSNTFSALRALKMFLRKDQSDGTSFLLKLLGGAEFGVFAPGISGANIDAQGAAELLSLVLRGALMIGEYKKGLKGANIDEQGAADLLSILVRDGMESANFSTGALGAGFCLKKDENGDSYLEVDRMLVRKVATFIQLLIQQIKHVGGQIILTPASMSCAKVEDMGDYYRCYFENTDGEKTIEQEFVVGDLARAQTFNVKEGVNENVTNTYYWRAVVGVGDNYIDLSKTDCDAGSTEPKAGDDIVQLGNKTDATRQAAIILSAYGNDAPYFKLYRGINSYSLDGKEFVSFSRSEVMIIADTIRFSSGESLKDYIDGAIDDVNSKVDDAISDLSENISFVNQLSKDLEAVKNQVDGAIETWFYEPVPTLSNEPAVNWTTNEAKDRHLGDLYYDGNGKAYRFQMSGASYVWQVITDSDITKALANAKAAQDTADGKRRVFVSTPTNSSAYDVGDLWVNATYGSYNNDLLRCKTAKQANAQFSIGHWELASKYTDDTKANQAQASADAAKQAADSAQQTANNAVQSASTANALLSDIANDNKLTAQEKQETKKEWDIIVSEKSKNDASADKYGVSKTAYDTAYSALSTYITPLLSSLSTTSNISGTTFRSKFKDYYDARTDMLNAISAKAKSLADAAQQTADKAQQQANQAIKDAANAKVAADNAQSDADEAKSRLDSWASDGSISPTEKQSLKEEIARIDADKTQIANGYNKYSLGTPTAYNNAHTAYRAVLVTLTASSPETITIPSDFSTKQTTYYTQRTTALTAISNAARDYAQGIANDLSSYKQTVSSQFEQTNNSITAAVTSSKEYTNNAIKGIQIGARNYVLQSGKWTTDGKPSVWNTVNSAPSFTLNGSNLIIKKTVTGNSGVSAWLSENLIPGESYVFIYKLKTTITSGEIQFQIAPNYNGNLLKKFDSNVEEEGFVQFKAPDYSKYCIWINLNYAGQNSQVELEYIGVYKGTLKQDWSPAPEDAENALTEYKKEVTSQFSVLEGEINSKVSSTEITTIKQEIINTAASDATKKANDAKTSAISTASADATSKANQAKQDAISTAATDATNKANQAKNDAITTAGQNADKKYATITTVSSMQTSITQLSNSLSLKAEKSEVTAVQNNLNQTNNNLSALTTRVSKAEVALEPDNIWIGISSRVTTTGKLNNIVPDSCFDDTNYSLLYSGGQRIQKDLSPSGCPTSYCMKSTASIVYANNGVSVALGEKYYISAVVNASSANYQVLVGLMLKSTSGSYSYLPIEGVTAKTTGWKTISGYVTIPSNIVEACIYFKINGSSNLGTAYFTKIYAYKVDSNRNNLALNSKGPWTANKYQLVTYLTFVAPLKSGTIYTVSWKGSGTGNLAVYFSNGAASSARQGVSNGIPVTANSNYQGIAFYSEHFKLDPSLGTDNGINLTVSEVKVEEGERATDWCYSEGDYSTTEEIKAGISITENTITILGKAISLQGKITFSSLNSSLQSTINGKANSSDVTSSKDDIAKKLGYSSYSDMANKAAAGNTIINGGYIRTSLIDTNTLVAKTLNAVNDEGISTIVDKEGMRISQNNNLLLSMFLRNSGGDTYGDINMFSYDEGTTNKSQAIAITPRGGLELVSYKSSDEYDEQTKFSLGELSMVDKNKAGILINKTGITLNYAVVSSNTTTRYTVHYAKCIYSAYISSSGSVINKIGTNIPNGSGNPITFSASRTATGTYKITHNIGDTSYKVQITPIRGSYFPIMCVKERTSTYFVYACAHYVNGGFTDADCAAFVNVYYESPKLGTF